MSNRKRCLSAVAAAMALTVAGCMPMAEERQGQAVSEIAKIKIGVCIYDYKDTYITSVRQAIQTAAKTENVELTVNDSKNDQETQNGQIDALIQKGVDVLAVNIVDITQASAVIDKASSAGIPVVFFNREPKTADIKAYSDARFIGTKPEEAGIIQGELMRDIWRNGKWDRNSDGKIQYVMLVGDPENPEAIARTKYSIETVEASGIQVENLGETSANWDSAKAKTVMTDWLAENGDKIEFVVANNDGMAAGAIAALNEAGYNKGDGGNYIPVFGVDATDEAVALITNGKMSATVKQDAVAMGEAVLRLSLNAGQRNDFLSGTSYKYDETGIAIRIPYQSFTGK